MNLQQAQKITELLNELETDIMVRRAYHGDPQFDSWFIIKLELSQDKPDFGYILGLLCAALQRPFTTIH